MDCYDCEKKKTIAAVVCTYNGEKYISSQLTSIIKQSVSPDFILIIDDCSDDRTVEKARMILSTYKNPFRIIKKKTNLGLKNSIEIAVNTIENDWILFADQDDVWKPNKVEEFSIAISHNKNANLIFTDAIVTDTELQPIDSLWNRVQFTPNEWPLVNSLDKSILFRRNVVTGATMGVKTTFAKSCLPIVDIPYVLHDYWFALNGLLTQSIVAIPNELISYRQHGSNTVGVRSLSLYSKVLRTLKKIGCTFEDIDDNQYLALELLKRGNYNEHGEHTLQKWIEFEEKRKYCAFAKKKKIKRIRDLLNIDYSQFGRNKYHIFQDICKLLM